MTAYETLSEDDQVEALRPVALEAAARFGLEVADLGLVTHAYNTTFALTAIWYMICVMSFQN